MEITGAVIYFKQKYGFNHIRLLKVVIFLDFLKYFFMRQKWGKNPEKNPKFSGICSEIVNKQAGPNKRAGWNFFKKLISEQGQIRASRMEKPQKINKRACSVIRQVRVGRLDWSWLGWRPKVGKIEK